jgi:hypothetical protein
MELVAAYWVCCPDAIEGVALAVSQRGGHAFIKHQVFIG